MIGCVWLVDTYPRARPLAQAVVELDMSVRDCQRAVDAMLAALKVRAVGAGIPIYDPARAAASQLYVLQGLPAVSELSPSILPVVCCMFVSFKVKPSRLRCLAPCSLIATTSGWRGCSCVT